MNNGSKRRSTLRKRVAHVSQFVPCANCNCPTERGTHLCELCATDPGWILDPAIRIDLRP